MSASSKESRSHETARNESQHGEPRPGESQQGEARPGESQHVEARGGESRPATIDPVTFVAKWKSSQLGERQGYTTHFNELCEMLGVEKPVDSDILGQTYCFEKHLKQANKRGGFADVWKKGFFAWEYKKKGANLDEAHQQLLKYSVALEHPPLLVTCDFERIVIHTNWTNAVSVTHEITLDDLIDPAKPGALQMLRDVFVDPERLRPRDTRFDLTQDVARQFAGIADNLRKRYKGPEDERAAYNLKVAHFINRLVFCMFADDVGLLPDRLFRRLLEKFETNAEVAQHRMAELFEKMRTGGDFGVEPIEYFNGGLFDSRDALELTTKELRELAQIAKRDWSQIEPSIFGTLFERGLDPAKRSQLGAHYTEPAKIEKIIDPVIRRPLLEEWREIRERLVPIAEAANVYAANEKAGEKARDAALVAYDAFIEKLAKFRVLDPACGSGNFLYVTLLALKEIEYRAAIDILELGLTKFMPLRWRVGPENLLGIEINEFAVELARMTVWIGEIQWRMRRGVQPRRNPILSALATIEHRDALLNPDGTEAEWPKADVIVGNPPFLGDRKMIRELGEDYTFSLRGRYEGAVPGGADLVCYWFEKARAQLATKNAERVGLVATNSIRGGANRVVLDRIVEQTRIFEAWSDEPWVNDGAAVRVSLVCFGKSDANARLDGRTHDAIAADLSNHGTGAESAERMTENEAVSFVGTQKNGAFDVPGDVARDWIRHSGNPNGRNNLDVVRPWMNAKDITSRDADRWVIDFGAKTTEESAALYEMPFEYTQRVVKPMRVGVRRKWHREMWWLFGDWRPGLRSAVSSLPRFIATPMVAKYRLFVFVPSIRIPENLVVVIARDDDTTFGVLHSRIHEIWSLRKGTSLEDRPRYTPTTTFETFPFPEGLTPNIPAERYKDDPRAIAIAEAARALNEQRENWLNPPDLVKRVPEVVPGYPERVLPVNEAAAEALKKLTLTNLYNKRPTWLVNAHRRLDVAVAAAYGWEDWDAERGLSDDEILRRLFVLNQERAGRANESRGKDR